MTSLDGLNPDFRDLIVELCDARVEFLVVGAYALAYHGHPRATGDIDILVRPSADNARRTMAALTTFGAPLAALGITQRDFETQDTVCQLGQAPRRIDILTSITGITFEEAWATRVAVAWRNRQVQFLSRQALIVNKRASGRPKDLADAERLERGPAP